MIRLLNFSCFAVTVFACLGLYRVSEETRVARADLRGLEHEIVGQQEAMKVLEADWERVSDPARIQQLAARLGVNDTPVALASFDVLPRRGDDKELQQASTAIIAPAADPRLQAASLHAGE